jgi:hypothetical protein
MAGFYGKLGQPVVESEPVGVDGQGIMIGELRVITRYHDEFYKSITAKIKGLASMISQCDAKSPELNEDHLHGGPYGSPGVSTQGPGW